MMRTLVVIPARMQSVRFPGKPLAVLTAPDGTRRTLIEWCWRAAQRAVASDAVIVATDHPDIARAVADFGGKVALTPAHLRNGTERCAAVLGELAEQPDVVINWQGDNPLLVPEMVVALCQPFSDPSVAVATPCVPVDPAMRERIMEEVRAGRVGGTCVVTDRFGRALYFSKYPIPHGAVDDTPLKLHVGLYAYRTDALARYMAHTPSVAEQAEGLEQLRFLDIGVPVQVIDMPLPHGGLWEVNNPEDVPVVERLLPISDPPEAVR